MLHTVIADYQTKIHKSTDIVLLHLAGFIHRKVPEGYPTDRVAESQDCLFVVHTKLDEPYITMVYLQSEGDGSVNIYWPLNLGDTNPPPTHIHTPRHSPPCIHTTHTHTHTTLPPPIHNIVSTSNQLKTFIPTSQSVPNTTHIHYNTHSLTCVEQLAWL